MSRRERPRIFCHMDDFPRGWNEDEDGEKAIVSRNNNRVLAMSWFGSIKLDLDDEKAIMTCVEETRAFADLVEKRLAEYKQEKAERGELVSHD